MSAPARKAASEDEFHAHLHGLVVTLRDRSRKDLASRELSIRFQEALTILDAAQMLQPLRKLIYEKFRERFCVPAIVNPIRQRDWDAAVSAFKGLAEAGIESRRQRQAAGEQMDDMLPDANDLAVCLSMLTADMCSKVMPLKNLDALFHHAALVDTSKPVRALLVGFNDKYLEFLENMCAAFPAGEVSEALPAKLERALMYDPSLVYDRFAELVKPHIRALQDMDYAAHLFSSSTIFFGRLPYMDSLPMEEQWSAVVHENESNGEYVWGAFTQLVVASLGLPANLISRDFIEDIKESVNSLLSGRQDMIAAAQGPDGQPDIGRAMGVAMQVVSDMQSSGALQGIIDAVGAINADINPEMLQVLTDNMQLPEELRETLSTGLDIANVNETAPAFPTTTSSSATKKK
jgi:hypothetical protein